MLAKDSVNSSNNKRSVGFSMPDVKDDISEEGSDENFLPLSLPPFDQANPRVWFLQVEAGLRCGGITSQDTMFSYIASQVPSEIASEVVNILDAVPKERPYDVLKDAILKYMDDLNETRQQLLTNLELGERTPSQLLRHMRSLIGSLSISNSLLWQLWTQRLPSSTRSILSVLVVMYPWIDKRSWLTRCMNAS